LANDDSTELPYREARLTFLLDLERITLAERMVRVEDYKPTPYQEPLVYFHVLGGELMYIGQTVDLFSRQAAHRRGGRDWDEEWLLLMPSYWPYLHRGSWMDGIESSLINYLNPPYNVSPGRGCSELGAYIREHLRATNFLMPNGITVSKPVAQVVRARSLAPGA
jgi:hypothetical protein